MFIESALTCLGSRAANSGWKPLNSTVRSSAGLVRDTGMLANEQPAVLQAGSELYAVPAVLGSAIIVVTQYLHLYGSLAAGLAAIFVFILRIAALHYGWHAPQPKRGSAPPDDDPSVTGVTGVTGVTSVGADTDSRDNA